MLEKYEIKMKNEQVQKLFYNAVETRCIDLLVGE